MQATSCGEEQEGGRDATSWQFPLFRFPRCNSHHIEDYQPPPRKLSEQQESSSESDSDLDEGHDQELPPWKHNIISIFMPNLLNNVPNPWGILLCLGFLHILVLCAGVLFFTSICPIEMRCYQPTTYRHWNAIVEGTVRRRVNNHVMRGKATRSE